MKRNIISGMKLDNFYYLEYSDYCLNLHCYIYNVSVDASFDLLLDKLAADLLLKERNRLPIDNQIEILTFYVKTTDIGMGSDMHRQEEKLAIGSLLSPLLVNVYMECFEEMALGSTSLKPSL